LVRSGVLGVGPNAGRGVAAHGGGGTGWSW
jgi:hypothetical protein